MYSHSLLNSNGRKSYARTSLVELSQVIVMAQIRKSFRYAAAQGRGGEGKLTPGARSKQGQKVRPLQTAYLRQWAKKTQPEKSRLEGIIEANKTPDQLLQDNTQSKQQNTDLN